MFVFSPFVMPFNRVFRLESSCAVWDAQFLASLRFLPMESISTPERYQIVVPLIHQRILPLQQRQEHPRMFLQQVRSLRQRRHRQPVHLMWNRETRLRLHQTLRRQQQYQSQHNLKNRNHRQLICLMMLKQDKQLKIRIRRCRLRFTNWTKKSCCLAKSPVVLFVC